MQEPHQVPAEPSSAKDASKIYFFIFAIAALLATNIYFYFKYKDSDKRVALLSDDKVRVEAEIDQIELSLDQISNDGLELTEPLKLDQDNARAMIANLRAKLSADHLNRKEIDRTWSDVRQLRYLVSKHMSDLALLKLENIKIAHERDSLLNTVKSTDIKVRELEGQKSKMQHMVKLASALKVSAFSINTVRVKSDGRESTETRAKRADQFKVSFTLAENPVAGKGPYNIFMRVIDPNGNLIIDANNLFQVEGEDMQYTHKTTIDFSDDGKLYMFPWVPHDGIKRGTYTFVLYTNGFLMGRASINLK